MAGKNRKNINQISTMKNPAQIETDQLVKLADANSFVYSEFVKSAVTLKVSEDLSGSDLLNLFEPSAENMELLQRLFPHPETARSSDILAVIQKTAYNMVLIARELVQREPKSEAQ